MSSVYLVSPQEADAKGQQDVVWCKLLLHQRGDGDDCYAVRDGPKPSCSCKGFRYHRRCRHVAGQAALRRAAILT